MKPYDEWGNSDLKKIITKQCKKKYQQNYKPPSFFQSVKYVPFLRDDVTVQYRCVNVFSLWLHFHCPYVVQQGMMSLSLYKACERVDKLSGLRIGNLQIKVGSSHSSRHTLKIIMYLLLIQWYAFFETFFVSNNGSSPVTFITGIFFLFNAIRPVIHTITVPRKRDLFNKKLNV